MSEELKEKVLRERFNKAHKRLPKDSHLKIFKGEENFRETIKQLRPEIEEARLELIELALKKELETNDRIKKFGTVIEICKYFFIVLAFIELIYLLDHGSGLSVVLIILFILLSIILSFGQKAISSYKEKLDAIETGLEIENMIKNAQD